MPRNLLPSVLTLLWLIIGIDYISYQQLIPSLPSSLLTLFNTNPMQIYSQLSYGLFIGLLAIASITITCGKSSSRNILLLAIIALFSSILILKPLSVYLRISGVNELCFFVLGIVLVLILNQPKVSEINSPFATVKNLRIMCGILIIIAIISEIILHYTDPLLPTSYLDYSHTRYLQSYFPSWVTQILVLGYSISLIGLCLKQRSAKYFFTVSVLTMMVDSALQPYATSTLNACFDNFNVIMNGMILAVIYTPELSQQLTIRKNWNLCRTIILSFYSKKFYREVANEKTGRGLWSLFALILILQTSFTYEIYQRHPLAKAIAAISDIQKPLPKLVWKDGKFISNYNTPYIINDSKQQPVMIIDTTGKYKELNDAAYSVNVLITQKGITYRSFNNEIHRAHLANKSKLIQTNDDVINFLLSLVAIPLIVFFIACFIFLLALAYFGVWLRARKMQSRINVDNKACSRLAALSMTPGIITMSTYHFTQINIVTNKVIYLLIISFIFYAYQKLIVEGMVDKD